MLPTLKPRLQPLSWSDHRCTSALSSVLLRDLYCVGTLMIATTSMLLSSVVHLQTNYILHASLRQAKIMLDPITGRSKGYGFVAVQSEEEAEHAI